MDCANFGVFWCFVAVSATSLAFAVIELLLRFKAGNEIKIVLFGKPQYWYYAINILFACGALFASEALELTKLFSSAQTKLPQAIVQSAALALASLVAARTSFGSGMAPTDAGDAGGWGPGVLVGKLLAIVDEKIEQNRFIATAPTLKSLAESCLPVYIYSFVLPYCFAQSERRAGPAEIEITKKLQEIEQKSDAMLTLLHKEFGSACLNAAIQLLGESGKTPNTNDPKIATYVSQSDKLDELYLRISQL
jgi:hypothetical protein